MKKIFWIFTIRGKLKKLIAIREKEQLYFNNAMLKSPLPSDEARYLLSRIEIKKETISTLKQLL